MLRLTLATLGLASLPRCAGCRTSLFDDFAELIHTGQICKDARAIVYSCGNGRCEPEVGESVTSCAADCTTPATPAPPSRDEPVVPYYVGVVDCGTHTVYYPRTVAEAQQAMQARAGRRVRVIGTRHTGSGALCADGDGIVIDTSYLNAIEGVVDWGPGKKAVVAQAGAHMWEILSTLAQQGLALGFNAPGYGRLSIGGFLAVGGHGSSDGGATITERVVAIEKMNADGQLAIYLPQGAAFTPADPTVQQVSPEAWRALLGDLGALGMTTRVFLQTRPQFHVRSRIVRMAGTQLFAPGGLQSIADSCDYAFGVYYQSLGSLDLTCGKDVGAAPLTGDNVRMELFAPPVSRVIKDLYPGVMEATAYDNTLAGLAEAALAAFRFTHPWILWDEGGELRCGNEAVGEAHRMIETVFDGLRQPKAAQRDWEVAIPESKIDGAMSYIRTVLAQEKLYNPTIGVVFRLDRAHDTSLLASSATRSGWVAGERVYYVEFPKYFPKTLTPAQREEYERPYVEMVQTLMRDHGAQPHFGKNRDDIFRFAYEQGVTTAKIDALSAQVCTFDPAGAFRSAFLENAGVRWTCGP